MTSKTDLTQKEVEALASQELAREARTKLDPSDPTNFNIHKNHPLPEDFENPPIGDPGHFCIDRAKNYRPDWVQLNIMKNRDKQIDPVVFPLGGNIYEVPLDRWVDAPPEILISLKDAVETEHLTNWDSNKVRLGEEIETSTITRRRFFWETFPSATV